jgi:acyl-CoA thioester hydrolase
MLPHDTATHDYPIDVEAGAIDELGHVNNAIYLNWVQAAVLAHWRHNAPPKVAAAHLWVALKHEITYRRPAFLGDHLVVRVVLQKLVGARAFYHTSIRKGATLLVEVESAWCCLHAASRRPARLAPEVVARFLGPEAA